MRKDGQEACQCELDATERLVASMVIDQDAKVQEAMGNKAGAIVRRRIARKLGYSEEAVA